MKKMVCLVLALVLCLNVAALAEYVPSKTTEDMTQIEVAAENMPGDASLYIEPRAGRSSRLPASCHGV